MSPFTDNSARTSSVLSAWLLSLAIITPTILAASERAEDPKTPGAPLPSSCRVLSEAVEISFPFEIYRGDIRFRCEINGREAHMLLDDGFMWDELCFWGGPRVDSLDLTYDGSIDVGGSPGASNMIAARTASGITVRFPNVEFTNQRAVVMPSSSGASNMWMGSDGQISAMLFKNFVVDIDFDRMMITLVDPAKFEYDGAGAAIPWEPLGFGPWSIPARIALADGRQISLKLLMDLGYNDQLQLATGGENNISLPDRVLPANLGMNIQGVSTLGYVGRLPKVEIGGYAIDDVLVAYAKEEGGAPVHAEAMIGLGLLSRFNLTFDYSRRRLIIEPNGAFEKPFEYDMSGLSMRKDRDGALEIVRVFDNSPGSEAGLRIGDAITRIDGRLTGEIDIHELLSIMTQKGRTVRATARRDGREWEATLVLRRLI